MTRLLIDVGNTRVKWALVDDAAAMPRWDGAVNAGWLASGAVLHAALPTLEPIWRAAGASEAVIAHVAGAAMRARLEQLLGALPALRLTWFASVAAAAGVRNGYREPSQLGCDRFATLIGARALFPQQELIVATCGTATTIDALDVDGNFVGGMILPGLGLMATALASNTAQLPHIGQQIVAPPLFADHTDAAIVSGCLNAQAGAIERAVAARAGARCLLSGGAAAWIAPMLTVPSTLVDNLVLLGLQAATTRPPC
jgi:type III pantothenate kinase